MSLLAQMFGLLRRRFVFPVVTFLTLILVLLAWLPGKQVNDEYMEQDPFIFDNINRFIPSRKPFYDFIDPDEKLVLESFDAHKSFDARKSINKVTRLASKLQDIKIHIHRSKTVKRRSSCVRLETATGFTPICIYNVTVDRFISSFINDYRTWEPQLVRDMNHVLRGHPDMHLVDLGASIGVYTLNAARLGRNVVAVDALKPNLDLLYSSLVYGKLRENVTLLWNALSDRRMRVRLRVRKGNIGGTHVEHKAVNKTQPTFLQTIPEADAILLDDLTGLVSSRMHKVFMKMDIESSEALVLRKSSEFFQTLDVRYVQMEWMLQRNSGGLEIMQFMTRNGFLPYSSVNSSAFLQADKYGAWPDNIVWIKR